METDVIRELLERGVLFSRIEVPHVERVYEESFTGRGGRTYMAPDMVMPPKELGLFCSNSRCEAVMDWFLARDGEPYEIVNLSGGYSALEYRCRHTPADKVVFFVSRTESKDGRSNIELVGRDPRPTPSLSAELQKAFGEIDHDRYSKALDCRSRGLGVAALVYMRRVIESEMDQIIDLIVETLPDGEDSHIRDALIRLKGAYQFAEKAGVADAKLPPSYFPGNQNPFARLHDLTSDGVHNLDDVESAERFDECRDLFEMLFEKLLRDRHTQRLYRERLTSLKRKPR